MENQKEDYMPPYSGFQFNSKKAQYAYLKSLWPHLQHKVLAYLHYKRLMDLNSYVTIDEISNELDIHKGQAQRTLILMTKRGHLRRDRSDTPHKYWLTPQGQDYAEYVFIRFYKYKIDITNYLFKIAELPSLPIDESTINRLNSTSRKSFFRDYIKYWAIEMLTLEITRRQIELKNLQQS